MPKKIQFLSDAQLKSEAERCLYCEEKPCRTACPADCSPADFLMAEQLAASRRLIRMGQGIDAQDVNLACRRFNERQ